MANVNQPFGFIPVRHRTGAPYNGQFELFEIPVGETLAVFKGDLMKASDQDATDYYPAAERVTTGEVVSGLVLGSVIGFVIPTANGTSMVLDVPIYRAASTKRFVMIATAPDLIFEVQDGATVAFPIASIGLNCGIQGTAGSTVTGLSNMTTGATAATTTNTLPLTIVGIKNSPENTPAAQYQKLFVQINQHQYMGGQTSV